MACLSVLCLVRSFSIVCGLAAFSSLGVSFLLFDWIEIHVRARVKVDQPVLVEEGSGEDIFTTIQPAQSLAQSRGPLTCRRRYYSHRFISIAMFNVCLQEIRVPDSPDYREYNPSEVCSQESKCWTVGFLDEVWMPDNDDAKKWEITDFEILKDIPRAPGVKWPLFACAAGVVIAMIVTSAGMAMNNAVIVAGAAIYLFSGLSLGVTVLHFFHLAQYSGAAWNSPVIHEYPATSDFMTYSFEFDTFWTRVQHSIGPAVHFVGATFVLLFLAAASAIAHFKIGVHKTTTRKLIRREREAIARAPPHNDMVQIVTKL